MFDSGVGGLSVLAEVRVQLPDESVVYVADQDFAPYGERTLDEVRARAAQMAGELIDVGAKAIVVACNSASAAALHKLRNMYENTPFVGMEPAVKPAALETKSGLIGVLATSATFRGELFTSVIERYAAGTEIMTVADPALFDLVESGDDGDARFEGLLESVMAPLLASGIDTLVLGCTHYSFLTAAIQEIAGPGLSIIDPAPSVARQVGRVLDEHGMTVDGAAAGVVSFHTTADPVRFGAAITRLLGSPASVAPTGWPPRNLTL
jgi:glutamate racemase